MVRKSERNKAQGTPEKLIPERTRKSTRQALRRKKKSSSESEGEPDVVVDKDIKEQETSESKVTGDDGITWKIQSSNGSGGEIQKLKICRQRVTESNDSSSPTKEASPRRRKSTRSSKNLDTTPNDSTDFIEVNNESSEVKTPSEDVVIPSIENDEDTKANNDNQTEPVPEEEVITVPVNDDKESLEASIQDDTSADAENRSNETPECNNVEPVLPSTGPSEEEATDCEEKIDADDNDVQCQPVLPVEQQEESKPSDESSEKSSAELEQPDRKSVV